MKLCVYSGIEQPWPNSTVRTVKSNQKAYATSSVYFSLNLFITINTCVRKPYTV